MGTPCDDLIVAPPGIEAVDGGGGDDTIIPAPISTSAPCPAGCYLGIGSQTFEGGPGDDIVYGERGNDRLFGGEGNDQLFGGIGDDLLRGGPGNDRLAGGFGADSIDGEMGDDYVRGDATADTLVDRGGGIDTLSYSTGVAPGFFDSHAFDPVASKGLPPLGSERGAYLDLSTTVGDNGVAPDAGGVDTVEAGDFEIVVGTAFSDYIVGSGADETIYGGGGGDAILGKGGNDKLYGGADGDHLDGGEGPSNLLDGGAGNDYCASPTAGISCEPGTNKGGVVLRDPTKVSAGLIAPGEARYAQLYLSGSNAGDEVMATYLPGPPASVKFELGSAAPFDASPSADGGCGPPTPSQLICTLGKPLDSIVLAGFGGDDTMQVSGFPASVGVVLTGGEGGDELTGEQGEDVLADGAGEDTLDALGGDDAVLNNGGADEVLGGAGNDLFLSDSICDGDLLNGGSERDNGSWGKFKASGVEARLDSGVAGRPGAGGAPNCAGGSIDSLQSIEDLEGTALADVFYGSSGDNQLLGWAGEDVYFGGAGSDRILANSGDHDPTIDCGDDADTALIDRPPIEEAAEANCENVQEADVNNFRVETELEVPVTPPPTGDILPSAGSGGRTPPTKHRLLRACLAGAKPGVPRCATRPHKLAFGALGRLDRIRWSRWGGRRATGFGHLTILLGRRTPKVSGPGRIRLTQPKSCNSRRWYTHLTVTYGRGYHKAFIRSALSATPCD